MQLGPITDETTRGVKLGYYTNSGNWVYNEVHLYPERGENNLEGWTEILEVDKNGVDPTRTPENQLWTAFEFNKLHEIETAAELDSAWFTYLGTNVVYNNG